MEDKEREKIEDDKEIEAINTDKMDESIIRDDYAEVLPDFKRTIASGIDSYQENHPRKIVFVSIYSDSTSGLSCETNDEGIMEIKATGEEDNKRQRFFMGLQVEAGTLAWLVKTANLQSGKSRTPKVFGITNQCNALLERAIIEAQDLGDKVQRRVDEENYEIFPIYIQGANTASVNEDKEVEPDLMLIKKLINLARNTVLQKLGSKISTLKVSIVKWTEHMLCATKDGAEVDQMIPRAGIMIKIKTKDGNDALGIIRGAMGTLEEIICRYEDNAENVEMVVKRLAEKAVKEAIDLDRAGTNVVLGLDQPVISSSSVVGVIIHEIYGHTSESDIIVENRRSKGDKNIVLKSRLGAQVSDNKDFSLIDTPEDSLLLGGKLVKHNFGSLKFDGHGDVAKPVILVENGTMVGVMVDRHCIEEIKSGLKSDLADRIELGGSVRRQNYTYPPQVRMRNTIALPNPNGPNSLAQMAASIPHNKKGLYVETCHGGWVNPDTGDFQITAGLCYLIENGQVTNKPLRGIRLNGNITKIAIKSIGSSETITDTFSGYCGKNNQWVPVDGCGPIMWIENLSTAGVSLRSWSEIVNDYINQTEQFFNGQENDIYIPEVEDVLKTNSQRNICLVTSWFADETAIFMGLNNNPDFEIDGNNELRDRNDAHEA